ncbi:hypothetical protein GXM_03893 [Nostoc sphaeroides CCNUC1]|uniref:Uncharacterized protein n=1 Tax=Nostoc sphaeroides CCNUC1 TaxID=2653204 RepID=A0A5P8W167_9NOSO|nr:hypothetical protein GXM_03893 [Nostoc sphaeroides CCNUC1]
MAATKNSSIQTGKNGSPTDKNNKQRTKKTGNVANPAT